MYVYLSGGKKWHFLENFRYVLNKRFLTSLSYPRTGNSHVNYVLLFWSIYFLDIQEMIELEFDQLL